jgi:glycosyltransferase involved in cell wall biosynthesis
MRILVLIYEFPPIGGGGGRAAQDLYTCLVDRGHEIKLVTSHFQGLARREVIGGVEILRVPALRRQAFRAGFITMLAYIVSGVFYSFQLVCRWHPNLIHVHFAVPCGPVAWALHHLTGIPYVMTAHLGDVPGGTPEKTGSWFRFVYPFTPPIWRDAAQVVAVSEYTRQLAFGHYPVNIQVIPNGVDIHSLTPSNLNANACPQIVFAGRFVEQKNPMLIVNSLSELRDLPWQCTLLGDGALRAAVIEKVHQLGLQERVTLPGWLTPDEVIQQFIKSDIYFSPSRSEGLPVVGVQALALGLAIVASQVGGWIDLVDSGQNGYLVEPNNLQGFSQALRKLLSDPQKLTAFRQASRSKADQFDLTTIADRYEQVYNTVSNVMAS